VDAGGSYNFDILPLPLSLSSKHVLDRGVCTEKSREKAPGEVGCPTESEQIGTKKTAAKPISSDHQASGCAVVVEAFSARDFIVGFVGKGSSPRISDHCPMLMDLSSDLLRVFRCHRVSLLAVLFAGKHRMGRCEVGGIEDRCGGMIQCSQVGRIAEITFRA
jgi:hypothetical protein